MKLAITTEFNIGDTVYHITPESDPDIILDITYSVKYKTTKYYITFNRNDYDWYDEDEISINKTFGNGISN